MAFCPVCARPVAIARSRCLYCGAELPAESVSAAEKSTLEVVGEPASSRGDAERILLILDLAGGQPDTLARVLGISAFEAQQRAARGGFELLKADAKSEAEELVATLRTAGLAVFPVPEHGARARPVHVRGGVLEENVLRLRTEEGEATLNRDEIILVVRGPIAREYQTATELTKIRTATLAGGYLFHLHRKRDERPLELDPGNFEFGFTPAQGSLLELSLGLESLGAPTDDAFKKMAPALSPAAKGGAGVTATARALVRTAGEGALVLDNVEQFRLYSGWRGAVERMRG